MQEDSRATTANNFPMSFLDKFRTQWDKDKPNIEAVDKAFVYLRIILFCGGMGWLLFSDISQTTFDHVSAVFAYFAVYSVFLYTWLFISPHKKKVVYGAALIFDLLYASLLVRVTGGFVSPFFNSFYLITALYSFYYGLIPGVIIAAVAALFSFISCRSESYDLHWTNFIVKGAFLFLLAVPLGMLSQKFKKDKQKIENLNKDLEGYIEELRSIQGKLIEVEKLSAIGRLTADIAHEIRNPLTSIGGFARRLTKKLSPGSKEKDYADTVISEVDRLERILRSVLTFSREAKNKMKLQEINGIVEDSVRSFIEVCKDQSISLDLMLEPSLPQVLIDREQVREAINNLISNAIDAMPKGGILKVRTFMNELYNVSYVAVEVTDNGSGIPKEKLDMIFEPFYTTKEIGRGTGLGLSICKKIIDEHNGLITVESQADKGTTFTLFFPYQSEEESVKVKCWEFTRCGVEKAEGAAQFRCAAYPDYGRICWAIAGTFCGKKVSGAIAQKLGDCKKCEFYRRVVVRKDL
ncbi:MAG: sensor histidine kinase [Nitrospirae bacterium]|nr:sensor histidine kinase [Nitrospirota bacterium]